MWQCLIATLIPHEFWTTSAHISERISIYRPNKAGEHLSSAEVFDVILSQKKALLTISSSAVPFCDDIPLPLENQRLIRSISSGSRAVKTVLLLSAACGSLHLAVTTRGGTSTRWNCAMPGTPEKVQGYGAHCTFSAHGCLCREMRNPNKFSILL